MSYHISYDILYVLFSLLYILYYYTLIVSVWKSDILQISCQHEVQFVSIRILFEYYIMYMIHK